MSHQGQSLQQSSQSCSSEKGSELQRQVEAHKARLARLGPWQPYQAPLPPKPAPAVRPFNIQEPYFQNMWFWNLVKMPPAEKPRPSIKNLKDAVCIYFDITLNDLNSQRRVQRVAYPRQILMYLCRVHTMRSFPEIGRMIGDRDHTTILHGSAKIDRLRLSDWRVAYDIAMVEKLL